jgi:uncharacterized repeat protein (TIGR01451 family)
LAILAILALAVLAPAGLASVSEPQPEGTGAEQRAARHQSAQAEHQARRNAAAQKRAESRAHRQEHVAEKKARAEERRLAHAIPHGHKTDENAEVSIDCEKITVRYFGFPSVEDSPNSVLQIIEMKRGSTGLHIVFPTKTFTFEGTEATDVIPIAAPVGLSTVDLRSRWNTNGLKGGFDIHQSLKCPPNPKFEIEKLQSLGGPFTTDPLTGNVGQTVLYEMVITNTGNTPLTFSNFSDTVCDPGTIAGVPIAPVEPLESFTVVCAHQITAADATKGSLVNIAKITGTPEEGEGSPVEHESNQVVVTPKGEGREIEKEKTPEEPKGVVPPPTTNPTPKSGVLGTSGASSTSSSKSGVLGFASATVPSLHGPQGCVRNGFTASVKSAGVKSVVFYLDGHLLRTIGSSSARKGLLSLYIPVSKLKVGAHRVKATITMKPVSSGGKAAKASRSLTVVRCHSAVITPHFTG